MAAPKYDIIQTEYQNPHATDKLKLNMVVVSNTPEDELTNNIRESSQQYENWLDIKEPHNRVAVLIASGDSINSCLSEIKGLEEKGADIFTMNGSAQWARNNGIAPDYQVIVDAKEETSVFVDKDCKQFFASQCNPKTLEKATDLTLVHFGLETIEEFLPEDRVKAGGYALLGAGTTVGNAALSIAFSQGYRELHLFGYDSSYADDKSHGFNQPMNKFMPTTKIKWGGREFTASVAMKGQAEKFPLNALALKNAGCDIHLYGDGLLQTIYNTKYEDMTEKEKYQLMWNIPSYRNVSPGEFIVDKFLEVVKPDSTIIDFGCGTGKASIKLSENSHDVILVDFTDNCRDQEALALTFIQADLTKSIPVSAEYGLCTDVMEHIPTNDVGKVIDNIMKSADKVFFQISTVDDHFGKMIGHALHNTVKPHDWWKGRFDIRGLKVEWEEEQSNASLFYVTNPDRRATCQ